MVIEAASPSSFTAVDEVLTGRGPTSMGSDPVANKIKRDGRPKCGENVSKRREDKFQEDTTDIDCPALTVSG